MISLLIVVCPSEPCFIECHYWSLFEFLLKHYNIQKHEKDFVLELLFELESRDIEASQQKIKAEYDKMKQKR